MIRLTERIPGVVIEALAAAGDCIKTARLSKRLTVTRLANRMMVTPGTLRRLEGGDPTVSSGILASAMWALDMSVADVFPGGPGLTLLPFSERLPDEPLPAHLADDDF